MLVGEQPGDQEDRAGHPFVGPAGKLLDEALAEAGIERADVYVTNVVKHFKWSGERGKRRIHKKPRSGGDSRLPALARCRAAGGTTGGSGVSGRERGAIAAGKRLQREPSTRAIGEIAPGSLRHGDRASFLDIAGA